mmetsp:Transcript_3773/g.7724  ORF Transcript_3773/g.7724 Transcript_3773/m.7724 type:complete len:507 (-) Transcript_3773:78-1598(-)
MVLFKKSEVAGLPLVAKRRAAARYNREKPGGNATAEKGPWKLAFGIDVGSVLRFATNREVRKRVLTAVVAKASSGKNDNRKVAFEMLRKRQQVARFLGFQNYTALSLSTKMARRPEISQLLGEIKSAAWDKATVELQELQEFATSLGFVGKLEAHDVPHYTGKWYKKKHAIDFLKIAQYLELDNIMKGMFELTERLYGVTIDEAPANSTQIWDPTIRFYRLRRNSTTIAHAYFDLFSRPGQKQAGAWHKPMRVRSALLGSIPLSGIVMNKRRVGAGPVLMFPREVVTLFHEWGHALQAMMTTQKEGMAAGSNNVEWDAIEFPSQFMQDFAFNDPWTWERIARHHSTGEVMPANLKQAFETATKARVGLSVLVRVYSARLDLQIHERDWASVEELSGFQTQLYSEATMAPDVPGRCPVCGFRHIFAGAYAAGYYSYRWAEVLSSDAFGAFQEAGLSNSTAVRSLGQRFSATVLADGGGVHPRDLFRQFRGRDPKSGAMLRLYGLTTD